MIETMSNPTFTFTTQLWLWTSEKRSASWHFLSVEGDIREEIEAHAIMARLELGMAKKRGWGAVKVQARIGDTVWKTSIFPSSDSDAYLLPVKAAVRKAEGLSLDDDVNVTLELI